MLGEALQELIPLRDLELLIAERGRADVRAESDRPPAGGNAGPEAQDAMAERRVEHMHEELPLMK